jgi:hypothetical protein
MESTNVGERRTTNDVNKPVKVRIRVTKQNDEHFGKTGVTNVYDNNSKLRRVLMDEPNELGHPVHRWLFKDELEVIDEHASQA